MSTSSSTSERGPTDRPAGPLARLAAVVRLGHPFPSLLDGLVVGAFAVLAGGPPGVAALLAGAMSCLQLSIGALNDVVDADRDARTKPAKPIPAGFVDRRVAGLVAGGLAVAGLGLAAAVRPEALALAAVVLAIGYGYDLVLKPSPVSWLAFAVGIPFLPLFAWLGVGAPLPPSFGLLLPAAAVAGSGLAIGNTLVDVERDLAAAVRTLPVAIGREPAWRVHVALVVVLLAIAFGGGAWLRAAGPGLAVAFAGAVALAVGAVLVGHASAARRERGWELECVGTALLGLGWLVAIDAGS